MHSASFGMMPSAASFCNCQRIAAPRPASSQGQEGQMAKHRTAQNLQGASIVHVKATKNRQASQPQKLMASKLTFKKKQKV